MRRYAVVLVLFVLSMITYIDRACIASAKDPIARDLNLSDQAIGLVFGAFALGYALAQVPGGWLTDRFGARKTLTAVVAGWSLMTALTGAAWSLSSLVGIRFLFGIGEAGAFPGSTRALLRWLPASERGLANGILFSGSRIGAALAFPLLVWMLGNWSWRFTFVLLGAIGILWAAFWWLWFREGPIPESTMPSTFSLRAGLTTPAFLPVMVQYFASNFTFFLCLSWMLPYLKRQYALTDGEAARYAMIPLLFGAGAQWASGWLVDRLYGTAWSRRAPAILGFAMAGCGVLGTAWAATPAFAVTCFTLATFGADMTISPSWAHCADLAGKNAGAVSGLMNTAGNIGSFVSASTFPWLLAWTGSAKAYFLAAAALNAVAVLCWFTMRPPAAPLPERHAA